MPSWTFAIGHQRNLSGTRFISAALYSAGAACLPTTSSRWTSGSTCSGGLKLSSTQHRPGRLLRVLLALVADRLDDQQLRLALVQVLVERRATRSGGSPASFVALEDQRLAPLQHRFHELPHPADVRAGLLDHVGPADGLDGDLLAGVADADAQPVALDQLPALVGDVVGHLGRVERAVDEPGERLDLREGPLQPARLPAS